MPSITHFWWIAACVLRNVESCVNSPTGKIQNSPNTPQIPSRCPFGVKPHPVPNPRQPTGLPSPRRVASPVTSWG